MSSQVTTDIKIKHKDRNRTTVFWRGILVFPVATFVASFNLGTSGIGAASVIVLPALLAIVFRGKYPSYVLTFNHAIFELSARLAAYVLILNDKYPSIEANSKVVVTFPDVDGGKKLNRWLPLVKWFLAIPHYIVGAVYLVISLAVTVIAWVQTSITGRYPEWAGEIVLGTISYWNRVQGYMLLLVSDKYPSFKLK
ncbi:DUF4389 domain-containing protein [Actinobacteria bacterium IMCC26103]|nr:DUF4389 domain-containing protein [Actinobacteria bacterium IMCC26103]